MCEPYLSQYNYQKWCSFSSSVNHHAGIAIILHSSLAIYVIKKRFYKDRLISVLLQLPGRQDTLIIGAYIPPCNGSNNKLILECYSTLVSWITTARSVGIHVLLGGDINADYDLYTKNISDPNISSPSNPLFHYLHSHMFDDLCAFDSSSSPVPTFKSSSSGHLSRLDYIWISPAFPATYLWSHVLDSSDTFSTDHFLLIAFFDFINIKDLLAPSYLKQRVRCRIEYDFHSALPEQKEKFTFEVDQGLKKQVSYHGSGNLNRLWHQFKSSLLNAARCTLPK
jgi:exonuclease III